MENQNDYKNHNKPDSARRFLNILQHEYILIGKTRVTSWKAWLILGIAVGIMLTILSIALRQTYF